MMTRITAMIEGTACCGIVRSAPTSPVSPSSEPVRETSTMSFISRASLLGAAGLAAAAASPSFAQVYDGSTAARLMDKVLGGPRWGSVADFDVAGVRLGMTPEEARAALRKGGLVPAAEDPQQDAFGAVVSRRAAERGGAGADRGTVPMFTMARGVQGETVEVWYAAARDGARVTQVKYLMPTNRMEAAAFSRSVEAKYGRPTFRQGAQGFYCTKPERVCAGYASKVLPYLVADTGSVHHGLDLQMGEEYRAELKAETAAAVEAAAPKNAKASF
ncbi:MAG: hypothetical protein PGN23_06660 [Sphingomonas adhaesiva]|uniref:hypothetical protein n=1 Tax=Sphingomonas adhaesiva TaxID=28212 RepID=UPI002FFBD3FE